MSYRTFQIVAGSVVGALFAIMLFSDHYDFLWTLATGWLAAYFAANVFYGLTSNQGLRDRRLWDLSEFRHHEEFSLAAADEVFSEEKANALELRVRLDGRAQGLTKAALTSPLTGSPCLAWSLEMAIFRRTKLGGDADFSLLLRQDHFETFLLDDRGAHCRLQPPGLLNAGNFREEFYTWSNFPDNRALTALLDQGLVKHNFSKTDYRGVRVRETFLQTGEDIKAFGTLTKTSEGLVLRGNDILDDPGSLLIQADRAVEKKRLKVKRSPLIWLNVAFLVLAGLLLLGAVAESPVGKSLAWAVGWLNFTHLGEVKVSPGGQGISFRFSVAGQTTPEIWNFDATDARTAVALLDGDAHWKTDGATTLQAWLVDGNTQAARSGSAIYPVWQDDHWVLDLSKPRTLAQDKGPIWIRNHLAKPIKLKFHSDTSEVDLSGYWNLEAKRGDQDKPGTRLIFNSNKNNVLMATGDQITLESGGQVRRVFGVGTSAEVVWSDENGGWIVDVSPETLQKPTGSVWVLPPPGQAVTLTHSEARLGQVTTIRLPPTDQPKLDLVRNAEDRHFTLDEGQEFKIEVSREKLLYSGPLQACPWAKWEANHWLLTPPAAVPQ